jgi:hypothetical protein
MPSQAVLPDPCHGLPAEFVTHYLNQASKRASIERRPVITAIKIIYRTACGLWLATRAVELPSVLARSMACWCLGIRYYIDEQDPGRANLYSTRIEWRRVPAVLSVRSFRFFFVSSDRGEPPHVHVRREDKVAKFWLDPVALERAGRFSRVELNEIAKLIEEHVGGGEKGYQFSGREGARCGVTLWPAVARRKREEADCFLSQAGLSSLLTSGVR